LVEIPKETGNKLLNKINSQNPPNYNAANFPDKEIAKLRCSEITAFYSTLPLAYDMLQK